jgi:hypothetical protein
MIEFFGINDYDQHGLVGMVKPPNVIIEGTGLGLLAAGAW